MYPVVILAGGIASRMRPHTDAVPKALLAIAGQPFISHQLRLLRDQQIADVVLCVGHLGEQVEAFVGDGHRWGLRVVYSRDGDRLLGTGGALRRALPMLGDVFFVLYGDSYLTCDFATVGHAFATAKRKGLMTVFRNDNNLGASNVCFEQDQIRRYDKSAAGDDMHHIDYGLAVLSREALAPYPAATPFDLVRVYQDLLAAGELAGLEVSERFYEIGSPEGLRDTEALLQQDRPRS